MILKFPPAKKGKREVDEWEMVFVYRCDECMMVWHMAETDDKPEFCPYCGCGKGKP
jgi:rubrerythrin